MNRLLYLISPILIFSVLGCIQTSEPDMPNRINYLFNVQNVGNTLELDQDSILVTEIKILANKFNLLLSDEGKLQSQPDALIMAYRTEKKGDDELVLSVNIGYKDITRFKGLELFIDPPADKDNIQDTDFIGNEQNFSLIIKGDYNKKSFIYKSNLSFKNDFHFSEVVLTDDKRHLAVRVLLDIKDILIEESTNEILDPGNKVNKPVIDSLAQTSVDLEVFATDHLLF